MGSPSGVAALAEVHEYRVDGVPVAPPPRATVAETLRRWACADPGRPALTWCGGGTDAETLTYGQLDRRSRLLAGSWLARHDRARGLAVLAGNDIPSVLAIFAALRAGIPCLLLSPHDPASRLTEILAHHPVGEVLRSPLAGDHAGEIASPITVPGEQEGDEHVDGDPVPAEATALFFGTSGSTAASKLVAQSHRALISNALAVGRHHGLDRDTVLMGGLPVHHVNGVHFTLMASVYAGSHVILPQELSPFGYPALLERYRPHIASVVPTVLEGLLARPAALRLPPTLRYFVSAAAPLSGSLLRRFVNATGVRVLQGYGLSETTNFSTTVPVGLPDDVYREVAIDAEIPSVGVALDGNEVEVLGTAGERCADGVVGEICMRGHNVMQGYSGRPDLTAQAFAGGWFHSGDLGYCKRAGDRRRYFYITGRSKNISKVRGETVSLEEVERALLSLAGVRDAACVAVPHPTWGEQLVALVKSEPGADLAQMRTEAALMLPAAAVPTSWRNVETIPRTATGKLQRPRLRELVAAQGPA